MWNKLLLILFVGTFAFSLSAQQYRRYRSRRGRDRSTQTTTVQQTKTEEKTEKKTEKKASAQQTSQTSARKSSSYATRKFDPRKPALTQSYIDSVMDGQIRQNLLECKILAKLPGSKTVDDDNDEDEEKPSADAKPEKTVFISRLDFAIQMSRYSSLMANFELTEVTGIPLNWYQQYRTELNKFGPIINEMTIAVRARSAGRYAVAVQKFKAQQKACLKFLKEPKPKISKEQNEALVLKNSKIRLQNYLKLQEEKRRAALQRQQERLKQLQQKNQQNKKPAQGAGK